MTEERPPAGPSSAAGIPVRTRAFALVLLAAFAVCGIAGIEAWPLTGWRLFSLSRTPVQVFWEVAVVGEGGAERAFALGWLPGRSLGFTPVLNRFSRLDPARQRAVCWAWENAARSAGLEVRALRIYRLRRDFSNRCRRPVL